MNSNRLSTYLAMAAVPTAAAGFAHADSFYSYSYGDSPLSINLDNPFNSDSSSDNPIYGGSEEIQMNLGGININMFMGFAQVTNPDNSNSDKTVAAFGTDNGSSKSSPPAAYGVVFNNSGSKPKNGTRYAEGDTIDTPKSGKFGSSTAAFKSTNGDTSGKPNFQKGEFGTLQGEDLGYLGFSIVSEDGLVGTGWLSIGLNLDDGIFNLYGWGVGLGDSPVLAGQIADANPVPGPAGIFALAAGAAGIRRKRSRIA